MKKLSALLLTLVLSLNLMSQIQVLNGTYTTFDGREFTVNIIEGECTVLKVDTAFITDEQAQDLEVLAEVLNRLDSYYLTFKNNTAKEPSGGDANFGNKSSVAFVAPSCGAACGLIGAKGIEVSPGMFKQVFNEIKYKLPTNRIGIVAYEFGRNFFTMGGKLIFPFEPNTDERNGGFAEGVANALSLTAAIDYINTQDESIQNFNETLVYYNKIIEHFSAYINDLEVNPYNSMARDYQISDINRNTWRFFTPSSAVLMGVRNLFDQEDVYKKFFENLEGRDDATSIETALGNIVYAYSYAVNYNLLPLFQNVLRFSIDEETKADVQSLPLALDRLIPDMDNLWFTSPFDTIPFNIRSINYLNETNYYQLLIDGELISVSTDGNNDLVYSMLGGKDQVTLSVKLLDSDQVEVDSYDVFLTKRTNLNISDLYNRFTFGDPSGYNKPVLHNGEFSLINLAGKESWPTLEWAFPITRNRVYLVTGEIKNKRIIYPDMKDSLGNYKVETFSSISIGGSGSPRIGHDFAKEDSLNFYKVQFGLFNTDIYFSGEWSKNLDYVSPKFNMSCSGITNGFFKNIVYKDVTDTDGDGFIDFEDDCPDVYGENNGCPSSSIDDITEKSMVKICPNPVGTLLTVDCLEDGIVTISDMIGRTVIQQSKSQGIYQIDVSHLSQGNYTIRIETDKWSHTSMLIK